jgi:hypothetical protein
VLTAVLLAICVGMLLRHTGDAPAGPVYTLSELQARLAQPDLWLGRTLRVWALAQPCPTWGSPLSPLHCANWQPQLVDPHDGTLDPPLPLAGEPGDPLLGLLRGLPVVEHLLPVQRLQWERPVTYRVRLRAGPAGPCIALTCYEAVLLDAAPDPPQEP